jgi:hypothetical protein
MGPPRRKIPVTTHGEGSGQKKDLIGERRNGRRRSEPERGKRIGTEVCNFEGRVAAWLGGIDPDDPPVPDAACSLKCMIFDLHVGTEVGELLAVASILASQTGDNA